MGVLFLPRVWILISPCTIEVTDGSVSTIYCWVSYPSAYLGPYRLESYYPYLLYLGNWYANGFWYSD